MASKSPDLEVRDLERFHRAHQESVVARAYRAALLDTSLNLPPCTVLYRFLARTRNGTTASPPLSSLIFVEKSSPTVIRRILSGTQSEAAKLRDTRFECDVSIPDCRFDFSPKAFKPCDAQHRQWCRAAVAL
jgi:hypothetical protein